MKRIVRRAALLAFPGFFDRGSNVFHSGEHGRKGDEVGAVVRGDQPRERRLARARRAPEDQRRKLARAAKCRSQQRFLADQIRLADELFEAARAHALGQRGIGGDAAAVSSGSSNRLPVDSRLMRGGLVGVRWHRVRGE